MNAMNRGAIRGIAMAVDSLREIVQGMSYAEESKENGYNGGVALDDKGYYSTSGNLEEAAICLAKAVKILRYVSEDAADFEEYVKGAKTSEEKVKCILDYGAKCSKSKW